MTVLAIFTTGLGLLLGASKGSEHYCCQLLLPITVRLLGHFGSLLLVAWVFFGFLITLLATTFWLGKDTLVGK